MGCLRLHHGVFQTCLLRTASEYNTWQLMSQFLPHSPNKHPPNGPRYAVESPKIYQCFFAGVSIWRGWNDLSRTDWSFSGKHREVPPLFHHKNRGFSHYNHHWTMGFSTAKQTHPTSGTPRYPQVPRQPALLFLLLLGREHQKYLAKLTHINWLARAYGGYDCSHST